MNGYSASLALLIGLLAACPTGAAPDADTAALLTRLAVKRRDAARKTYEVLWIDYRERRAPLDALYRWSVRWLEAQRSLSADPANVVGAYEAHYRRMRDLDQLIRRLRDKGVTTIDEVSAAEFYRVESELWWTQAKADRKSR
jgi:hypothetical protein